MYRTPRHLRSRGAVAVETMIVLPMLLLLAFGTFEFGLAWQRSREVNNATRSAARVVSNLGEIRQADWQALLTLKAGIGDIDSIEAVVIYKSTTPDGKVPPECIDASQVGKCNRYSGAQLKVLADSQFADSTCALGAPDAAWCPTDRNTDPTDNPDFIGVWVRLVQDPITGVFPGTDGVIVIEDQTVMRAEPDLVGL